MRVRSWKRDPLGRKISLQHIFCKLYFVSVCAGEIETSWIKLIYFGIEDLQYFQQYLNRSFQIWSQTFRGLPPLSNLFKPFPQLKYSKTIDFFSHCMFSAAPLAGMLTSASGHSEILACLGKKFLVSSEEEDRSSSLRCVEMRTVCWGSQFADLLILPRAIAEQLLMG